MGVVNCCVPLCKSNSRRSPGISFHQFPADFLMQRKWLILIARKNFKVNNKSPTNLVCSKHFRDEDFKRDIYGCSMKQKRLVPGAVPTIFENYPDYLISSSETIKSCNFIRKRSKSEGTVTVGNCSSKRKQPFLNSNCDKEICDEDAIHPVKFTNTEICDEDAIHPVIFTKTEICDEDAIHPVIFTNTEICDEAAIHHVKFTNTKPGQRSCVNTIRNKKKTNSEHSENHHKKKCRKLSSVVVEYE